MRSLDSHRHSARQSPLKATRALIQLLASSDRQVSNNRRSGSLLYGQIGRKPTSAPLQLRSLPMFSVSSPEGVRMVFTTYVTSCGTALTLSPLPHSNSGADTQVAPPERGVQFSSATRRARRTCASRPPALTPAFRHRRHGVTAPRHFLHAMRLDVFSAPERTTRP
jgi:hypothetical protein